MITGYRQTIVTLVIFMLSIISFAKNPPIANRGQQLNHPPYFQRGAYVNFWAASSQRYLKNFFKLAKSTGINTVVIDVKNEYGELIYKSDIALAKQIGAHRGSYVKDPTQFLSPFKQQNLYTIARIPVFKDALLAQKRPNYAVKNKNNEVWITGNNLSWTDPFQQQVQDYNIQIAIDAAKMGFDEIQYDYIRFPEKGGLVYSQKNSQDNRVTAIQNFLKLSQERLDDYDVKSSIATFGYACWNDNDTQIGQQLRKLAPFVDYISPMIYPSGFQFGIPGYANAVEHADKIISLSIQACEKRTGLPADRFRPWLQVFKDYNFDFRTFDRDEVQKQIQASEQGGHRGWLLWNPASRYPRQYL